MNALTRIAEFVQSRDLAAMPPERFDRVKRHVVDTWAAQMAGARTESGAAVGRASLDTPSISGSVDLMSAIVARCAQARCTEIDDIHLTSCTTPGAVVVSTALALAATGAPAGDGFRAGDFCAAVLAGYESMIRLGIAIDGPAALHTGVWPTAFAAAFGSAATASRLMALSVGQTAAALAMSLAFAQHRAVAASPAQSARWLSLGVAAANGVLAARAAHAGLGGTVDIGAWSARLTRGLGRHFQFDGIGMKPFPTARQALAAIEAARQIVDDERLTPSDIRRIVVALPEPQRAVVDRSGFPESRFDSIVSVRYQIALAIAAPDRLLDVVRTPLFDTPAVRRLLTRITVTRARELDARYPRSWPARVAIEARGRRHSRTVLDALGDASRPLGWNHIAAKASAIAAPIAGTAATDSLVGEWKAAIPGAPIPRVP